MAIVAKNVLVFPCGSECGLEINKALKQEKYVNLFGASDIANNHGVFAFENYIESPLPAIDEPDFIEKFNSIIAANEIEFILPALDSIALFLSKNRDKINAAIISSLYETNLICSSKSRTYELLSNVVSVPDAEAKNNLEISSGPEYTVDCFTDRHGELRFSAGRQQRRVQGGISVNSIRVHDKRFSQWAEKINSAMKFRGAWFYQVKQNAAGEFVLLEVAAGIAEASALVRNRGVNLPLLSVYDAMEMDFEILENDVDNEIDRALCNKFRINHEFEHVYVDFDDCLIIRGKVNTELVAFLYGCVNEGKKIYLLTRHAEDIDVSLVKYRLAGLFDEVIHIDRGEPKSKYVTSQPAIFIDDSHQERKDVAKTGAIVFACGDLF